MKNKKNTDIEAKESNDKKITLDVIYLNYQKNGTISFTIDMSKDFVRLNIKEDKDKISFYLDCQVIEFWKRDCDEFL